MFDQARQDVVNVADGKGVVGAITLDRALLAGAPAGPGLRHRVTLAAEQDELGPAAPGRQYGDGLGFRKPAEVVKVAVLTIGILGVAVTQPRRGGGQDGDGALTHHTHEMTAAARELGGLHHG